MATRIGTRFNDRLRGTWDPDTIWGDTDKFLAGFEVGGADTIFGGWGKDFLVGDAYGLLDNAQGGDDTIFGDSDFLVPTRGGPVSVPVPVFDLPIGHGPDTLIGDAFLMRDNSVGGRDTLHGEGGNDTLYGDAYDMTGSAIAGHDRIEGGTGDDTIYGNAYSMSGLSQEPQWDPNAFPEDNKDFLLGGAGNDTIFGDAYQMNDFVVSGHDHIEGGTGDDTIYGDAYFMTGSSRDAPGTFEDDFDALRGGDGNDTIFGDAHTISDFAQGGTDIINGNNGNDVLYGDAYMMSGSSHAGNDYLYGGAGDDYLFGDARAAEPGVTSGKDLLNGGSGNDHMWGGRGADVFVFAGDIFNSSSNTGEDVIHDFNASEGDTIDLGGLGIADFNDLNIHDDAAGNAVVKLLDGAAVTLVGVHAVELTANDFIFV